MALVRYYDEFSDETGEDDIPDAVISAAANASYNDDRYMVVGLHPVYGWVYRDIEDEGGRGELTKTHIIDSSGVVD